MAPYDLLASVSFESKIQFSASQNLCLARSKYLKLPKSESRGGDVWSIKPLDFSLRLYRSLSVPQTKERKACAIVAAPKTTGTKRTAGVILPTFLHKSYKRKDPPKFITSHRPPDALESELMFVKTGKFPSEPYKNPKLHNFRPLDEDLPDIVTTHERDPGDLHLKLKQLDTSHIEWCAECTTWCEDVQTTKSDINCRLRDLRTRMDTYKPAEPKWDARLILPQPPWPSKSASYTRHQRRRGTYSAFLDRVEEKLSRSWEN